MATAVATTKKAKAPVKATPKAEEQEAPAKPAKARIGMDEQEIENAVAGILEVRAEAGSEDQESLTTRDEKNRPKGRPLGVTTGLPILGAWCYIFQENEKAPERPNRTGRPGDGKMTDKQISDWMNNEFPGRNTPAFNHPAGCRLDYNRGRFTKSITPKLTSQRYDEAAEVIPPGTRGGRKAEAEAEGEGEEQAAPAKAAPAKPATNTVKRGVVRR